MYLYVVLKRRLVRDAKKAVHHIKSVYGARYRGPSFGGLVYETEGLISQRDCKKFGITEWV